jgi:hypothetical protein
LIPHPEILIPVPELFAPDPEEFIPNPEGFIHNPEGFIPDPDPTYQVIRDLSLNQGQIKIYTFHFMQIK